MHRKKLLLTLFSLLIIIILISCNAQNEKVTISGKLVQQTGELPPSEFSVILCPIRTNIFLQQVIKCSNTDSPSTTTSNGEFIIEEVSVGRYGMQLNPPNSGIMTIGVLKNDAGEDIIFQAKSGQDLDLGEIEVPEWYFER